MAALHKLLVDVMQYQNGDETIFRIPREYAADLVRQYAEEETKCYKNIAYHYRITLTAVSWSRQYPKNIIFGRDNPKLFLDILMEQLDYQKQVIDDCIERLTRNSNDFKTIMEKLFNNREYSSDVEYLRCLTDFICGNYTYETAFIDISYHSSILSQERIDEIMKNVDRYAICLFECDN